MMSDRFNHTKYLVRKKVFKVLGGSFQIFDDHGGLAFYVKQKAFKLKEDIRIYTSEDMREEILVIKARSRIDFSATYDVFESISNEPIGSFRRKGMKSILKDEWLILDNQDREIGLITEDNMLLAVIRRVLSNLVPQSYSGTIGQHNVFTFKQNFNPFIQKMELDFSMDRNQLLNRKLGIAASVLLGAVEGKQQ
jgi:signal-transduction protein with cAMP-binding, CBS, and nucleotidyltransferase domain